jgi:hypothetical protein
VRLEAYAAFCAWFCAVAVAAQEPIDPVDPAADVPVEAAPVLETTPQPPAAPPVQVLPLPKVAPAVAAPVEPDPLAPALDVAAASGGVGTCIGVGVCCVTSSCAGYFAFATSNANAPTTTCGTIAVLGSLGVCPVASGVAAGGLMSLFSEPGAVVTGISTGVFVGVIPLVFSAVFGALLYDSVTSSRTYSGIAAPLFFAGLGVTTIGSGVLGAIVGAIIYKSVFVAEPEKALP